MRKGDKRTNEILKVLLKYMQKDFSDSIPISENADDLNEISIGLNTMAEELQAYMLDVKKMNEELEQKVIERSDEISKKERRFRALIENSADGIGMLNEKGEVVYVSPSATKIDGHTSEELIGKVGLGQVHPDDIPLVKNLMETSFKNPGKPVYSQHRILHKEGHWVWTEGTMTNLLQDSAINALVVNFRDISRRKLAEEKLKASELEYRSLIDQATDGIFITDKNGQYLDVNFSACKMLGYTKAELLTLSVKDILVPEDAIDNPPRLNELMEGKTILSIRTLKRKDGSQIPSEINSKMLSSGKLLGMVRDISERKEAQDKILKLNEELEHKVIERTTQLESKIQMLKESEEKFQKAFQASAAGMSITRLSDSTYLDVNDAFAKMTGYTKEELIGHSSAELGLIADLKARDEVSYQIKEHGSAKHFEMTIQNRKGEKSSILASVETIVLGGQKHTINIIYDITERKKAEEQLESVNKELESFSFSISHDLRAPLRSIIGYTGVLEEEFTSQINVEGKRTLEIIQRNASKMNRLIDDLLEFSRLGKKELVKFVVDTDKVVHNALGIINGSLHHNTQIILKPLPPMYADKGLLTQVWINLLSNAIKYSSKTNEPHVEIGSQNINGETAYYVKDNGVGFDMHYANKLFSVFQRLHKAEEFEGTGVGLSIVKRIINKHGGCVWAEGIVNKGATFYFSLPGYPAFRKT